eukprot:jgi/Bigna1/144375/aug1.87_g19083
MMTMGSFDEMKDGTKKAANDAQKSSGHISEQMKKDFTKAGDAIKDASITAGDEIEKGAHEVGDQPKKQEVQQALAGTGIASADVAAGGAFAPELMAGGLAIQGAIESANTKSSPCDTVPQAGTACAAGESDFNKRGPGVGSFSEGVSNLREEGVKRFDGVEDESSDEAVKRCDDAKGEASARSGFDPTQMQSTDEAVDSLKAQIDGNGRPEQQLMDLRSGKALENSTNKAKSELKKEASGQGNKTPNDVLGEVSQKKSKVKKAMKKVEKKVKSSEGEMADVLEKVKQNQQRHRMSSGVMN